eukprot:3123098-Amphidinium_carterae.2
MQRDIPLNNAMGEFNKINDQLAGYVNKTVVSEWALQRKNTAQRLVKELTRRRLSSLLRLCSASPYSCFNDSSFCRQHVTSASSLFAGSHQSLLPCSARSYKQSHIQPVVFCALAQATHCGCMICKAPHQKRVVAMQWHADSKSCPGSQPAVPRQTQPLK